MIERVEYYCGEDVIQTEYRYPLRWGAPGKSREKKRELTPEEMEKVNQRNREKKLQRLILTNFKPGHGWHCILKYRQEDRPDTWELGKKQLGDFRKKIRKILKKAGMTFRWISVTERGKKGQALHHHMIIEDIVENGINMVKLFKEHWKLGSCAFIDLYEDGEYENLAEYIVKKETKEGKGCSYSRSRGNLKEPKVKKKRLRRKRWPEEPKPRKGFYIVKESVYNGENPVTGYPYQYYTQRRIARCQR